MGFTLKMNDGQNAAKSLSYDKEEVRIGRLRENDLVLYSTGVSRHHCTIFKRGKGYQIEDAGSSNGTIVNGKKISAATTLKDGDAIVVGPVSFVFKTNSEGQVAEHHEALEHQNIKGVVEAKTQAIDGAEVRRMLRQEAKKEEKAAAPAAAPAADAPHKEGEVKSEQPPVRRRRVTGQRRVSGSGGENSPAAPETPEAPPAAAPISMSEEGSASNGNGKRVTGDPARRARLAEAKKRAEEAKLAEQKAEPAREITAKVKPRKPFSVWWKEQPKKRRIMLATAAGLLVAIVALVIVKKWPSNNIILTDYSGKVFPLNATNSRKIYGLGKNIRPERGGYYCSDKVSFSFDYAGGMAVLRYSVSAIEAPNELAIYVNNKLAGYAPIASRWLPDVRMRLPTSMLNSHAKNIITFDSTRNPPEKDKWGIRQITITEKPLPEADPERAIQLFSLAQEAYKSYLVDPANLSTSISHYGDALMFLERLDPKPPLYGQIEVAMKEAEAALQEIYDAKMFQAFKAQRARNFDEAREVLNDLMRYLPNTEDERRQEVQNRLKYLGQNGG